MAAAKVFAPIKGRRMRITRLDECGAPVIGTSTTRVSKGFVSVALSPQYEDAETVRVKNAAGEVDFNEPGDASLLGMAATVTFTRVDPDLVSLITGSQTILDGDATAVGFRMSGGIPILGGWALEVWSDLAGQVCAGAKAYGYTLLPYLRGGKIGDFTLENGAASFSVSSVTREGAQWGTGPYQVVHSGPGATVPAKLLTAIGTKDHFHLQLTTVAPPAESAGLVALAAS